MDHQHNKAVVKGLPFVIRAWARNMDTDVVIGGDKAYTDWKTKTVHIPTLPWDDSRTAVYAYGYGAHEGAHVAFTSREEKESISSALQHSVYQGIEDVRVEHKMMQGFPGTRGRFGDLVEQLIEDGDFREVTEQDQPGAILGEYVCMTLRSRVKGQEALIPLAESAEDQLSRIVTPGGMIKVKALIARAQMSASTADSVAFSAQMITVIQEDLEEQEQQSKDDQQQGPGDGDGQGQRQGQGQSGGASGTEGQAGGDGDQSQNHLDPAAGAQALREMLEASADQLPKDLGEVLAERLGEAAGEAVQQQGGGAGIGFGGMARAVSGPGAEAMLRETASETNALRVRLQRLLQSQTRNCRTTVSQGRRLSTSHLFRAATGNARIFEKKSEKRGIKTVVHVLMDASGSMAGREMEIARSSGLSIAMALDPIQGVRSAVSLFPAGSAAALQVVRFGESCRVAAPRFAGITAGGGTPMAEAMMWAVDDLLAQSEPRKVIMVVTDGQPSKPGLVAEINKRLTAAGVEVYGIGINSDAGKTIFPNWLMISDVGQLPQTLFAMLTKALQKVA